MTMDAFHMPAMFSQIISAKTVNITAIFCHISLLNFKSVNRVMTPEYAMITKDRCHQLNTRCHAELNAQIYMVIKSISLAILYSNFNKFQQSPRRKVEMNTNFCVSHSKIISLAASPLPITFHQNRQLEEFSLVPSTIMGIITTIIVNKVMNQLEAY